MALTLKERNGILHYTESVKYYTPKISSLVLNMIYSLALFGGSLYALLAFNNYIHTNENFLSYFSDGLNIYEFTNASFTSLITESKINEVLLLLIKNFNIQVFSKLTAIMLILSTIMFIAVLFLTFVFNIIYIIFSKQLDKCNIYYLDKNGKEYNPLENRLNKGIKIMNISYSVITYISVLITLATVAFVTILAGSSLARGFFDGEDDVEMAVKASRILIIIGFVILFFIGTALIVKKGERIAETPDYIYYENLGTYLKGLLVTLIPLLTIAAIALFILLIVISLISIGARSDD